MYFCKACGKIIESKKSKEYCIKHYTQLYKYNKILDNNPRTIFDPNEIRIYDSYGEIDTYDQYGNVLVTYKFDLEDINYLKDHKWRTTYKGLNKETPYLVTKQSIYFHRLIMGLPNKEIDHINRDTTDNRKVNLRESFRTQQLSNTKLRRDNTHGIKGVYLDKRINKYHAEISINSKRYYSKGFYTLAEATYYRYLLEDLLYKDIGIHNSSKVINLISTLTEEQKHSIQTYFKNKMKIWV